MATGMTCHWPSWVQFLMVTKPPNGLLGAGEIRQLAEELDLQPTKKLGQNFVHDANTVRKIVAIAQLEPGSHVLEVGPGLGSLTLALLQAQAIVTAIEIDERLATLLPRTQARLQPGGDLRVIHGDALTATNLPGDATVLVANLPYNTSVPIVLHLLCTLPQLSSVVVMVQAEVAERLVAKPGSKAYGAPSVKAQWFGTWSIASTVSRQVFWPVPRVDSLVIHMVGEKPPGGEELRRAVWHIVDHAFATRRKMARGALASLFGPDSVSAIIDKAGLRPESRGEEWTLEQFVALARVWMAWS
jgi:16S rRNA (adenine1518-N6/adenine1519-N6)-dimethyltransferase